MKFAFAFLMGVFLAFSTTSRAETLRLRNFRELLATYEVTTGVSASDFAVAATYAQVKSRLPFKGQVGELSSPTLLAIYALAGSFCSAMVKLEAAELPSERMAFGDIDFTKGTAQFTPVLQNAVLSRLSSNFWQRDMTADETANLTQTFNDLVSASGAGATDTQNVAFMLCSEFGSSLGFLVN